MTRIALRLRPPDEDTSPDLRTRMDSQVDVGEHRPRRADPARGRGRDVVDLLTQRPQRRRLHCYRPSRRDEVYRTIPGRPYQVAAPAGDDQGVRAADGQDVGEEPTVEIAEVFTPRLPDEPKPARGKPLPTHRGWRG
ncbi:hypothetical protein GCM10009548_71560 [Streptomyces malaysiensis subsp. malaysiensis]